MKEGKHAFNIEVDEAGGLCALGETLEINVGVKEKFPLFPVRGPAFGGDCPPGGEHCREGRPVSAQLPW